MQREELRPIAQDLRPTLERSVTQWPALRQYAAEKAPGVDNVFFIGCGASLYVSCAAHVSLMQSTSSLTPFRMTSNEFNLIRPGNLGSRSLVVVISHGGGTPETVAAIETARSAGAPIVAITDHLGSPLADGADVAFVYGSDDSDWTARHVLLAGLSQALMVERGGSEDSYREALAAFEALATDLVGALESRESTVHDVACGLQDEALTYVVAAGPVHGAACCLAMCYMQEMQWMHASAVNAGDFFHGAFEVLTDEVPALVLLAEDATRPMAERALRFVSQHSSKAFALDTAGLSLPGVDDAMRSLVTPIAMGTLVSRLARHLAAVRNHSLDERRYMYKVPY